MREVVTNFIAVPLLYLCYGYRLSFCYWCNFVIIAVSLVIPPVSVSSPAYPLQSANPQPPQYWTSVLRLSQNNSSNIAHRTHNSPLATYSQRHPMWIKCCGPLLVIHRQLMIHLRTMPRSTTREHHRDPEQDYPSGCGLLRILNINIAASVRIFDKLNFTKYSNCNLRVHWMVRNLTQRHHHV